MREVRSTIATLSIVLLLFPIISRAQGEALICGFGSVRFDSKLETYLSQLGTDWKYGYARTEEASQAFRLCQERLDRKGLSEREYISECLFRSETDADFTGMGIHARGGVVYRIRLNFKANEEHSRVFRDLANEFGHPHRRGKYNEEQFTHNLVEWKLEDCRVVYDYGGVDTLDPVYLIFERLPEYQGGFNPPHVNLHFLKADD